MSTAAILICVLVGWFALGSVLGWLLWRWLRWQDGEK